MKALLGIAGLLLVVAIVGVLARRQLTSLPGPAAAPASAGDAPTATPQQQLQQFKQALDANLQAPAREMPGDAK
jgi:hypothetical protein